MTLWLAGGLVVLGLALFWLGYRAASRHFSSQYVMLPRGSLSEARDVVVVGWDAMHCPHCGGALEATDEARLVFQARPSGAKAEVIIYSAGSLKHPSHTSMSKVAKYAMFSYREYRLPSGILPAAANRKGIVEEIRSGLPLLSLVEWATPERLLIWAPRDINSMGEWDGGKVSTEWEHRADKAVEIALKRHIASGLKFYRPDKAVDAALRK